MSIFTTSRSEDVSFLPRFFPVIAAIILLVASTSIRAQTDLALNKTATASSTQTEDGANYNDYKPSLAFDGNSNTRWGSMFKDSQWIYVDLQNSYLITKVVLKWEDANAKQYRIDVSSDAIKWDTLIRKTDMVWGDRQDEVIIDNPKSGRYVRMFGEVRNMSKYYYPYVGPEYNGFSLWDFKVYGSAVSTIFSGSVAPAAGVSAAKTRTAVVSAAKDFSWSFELQEQSKVRLVVYDLSGKAIATLIDGYRNPGAYHESWNLGNLGRKTASGGMYVMRYTARP